MANDGASSISVAVRVRPFTIREAAQLTKTDDSVCFLGDGSLAGGPPKLSQKGIRPVIKVVDERCLVFDPPEDNPVQKFSRSVIPMGKRTKDQMFAFDRVFDENTTQNDVYEATAKTLLTNVMDGYNATVFAYGATGCGKTHTITGTLQSPGIIFLTMQELFERIGEVKEDKVTEISLSYLEIYNETIRDLLVPGTNKQGLTLREDANQAVSVSGLSTHHPANVDEVMEMIVRGNECRTMSPTEANATSSRSHAVLQINVAQKDRTAGTNEPHTMATLSIIDLAGSERASATKNRGERLLEGANINKSLLALGSCINALCDPRRRNHVPYRDSKLTRLLKFSLGGNCKTVMIVCVSPSSIHYDETQNTLRYANRAKNIQTKVTRNVFNVNRHVKDFVKKIDEQMTLINELKAQQKDYEAVAYTKFRKQNEKREAIVREGLARLRKAYDHSQNERQERVNGMKKLRQIEKRITMINSWLTAFDNVCENREEEEPPRNLTAMRKTAQGILVELESSRYHYHQRLSKSTWQRAIETALNVGLEQLRSIEGGVEPLEIASLERESELLKTIAEREFHMAVLEQEKIGDAALLQVLLTAHFETVAIINQLLFMDEQDAVIAAKGVLGKMLTSCAEATSHLIRPDGSLPIVEAHPPTRNGTPRRAKSLNVMGPTTQAANPIALDEIRRMSASPTKGSPRRRTALGSTRRGVSFSTPKRTPSKRAVRWRDDIEDGALAEFEKTPQHLKATPPRAPRFDKSPTTSPASRIPALVGDKLPPARSDDMTSSSPIPAPPQTSAAFASENKAPQSSSDRFKAGFLSRKFNDSPAPPTLSALPMSSSPEPSPLSESTSSRMNARSSIERQPFSKASRFSHNNISSSGNDSSGSGSGSGSDSERENGKRTSWIPTNEADAATIKAAVKRASLSRTSSQRIQRRRSPSGPGTGSSPPRGSDGALLAGPAKRLAERDASHRYSSILSPRTSTGAVQKSAARRATATAFMNEERLMGKSAARSHLRGSSVTAPTLSSALRQSGNASSRPGSAEQAR